MLRITSAVPARSMARAGLLCAALLLAGCEGPAPVKGFVLPEGDVEQGRQVFIDYNCHGCHSIAGVEFPKKEFEPPFIVALGGEVIRVKNYGELLTSVVAPDHVISPMYRNQLMQAGKDPSLTPMPYFGDNMTVSELIDLVEFLHSQYTRLLPNTYKSHYPVR